MKFWAIGISALLHIVVFFIYFGKALGPTLSPIWIEKGGAPIVKNAPRPTVTDSRSAQKSPEGETSPTSIPSGTGGDTVRSTVDQWAEWGNAPPEYPYLAQRKGWEGTVEVRIAVAPDQTSRATLEKSSGHSILDEAALNWARNCKVSVKSATEFLVPIVFRLSGK